MTEIEQFDMIVLGGGKAGKTLAMDRARAGEKVALVEAGMIGGSCINVACIPTKTVIRSAEIVETAREAAVLGSGPFLVDMQQVARRTAGVVARMVQANRSQFVASGMELVLGWGRFVEPRVIEVGSDMGVRRLTAGRIYLNLGTRAAIPPIPGLADAAPLTHVDALKLDVLPDHLLVLGGGYVGMELAQAFLRFGSRVTVLESGARLAGREDEDVSEAIRNVFRENGIDVVTDADAVHVAGRSGDIVTVALADGRSVSGSHILVAAGRRPMTDGIGLDLAGVELDARGFVVVDEYLRTSAPGIWAMGEVAGSPMFTHASLDDFRIVKNGLTGGFRSTAHRLMPYCIFIEPEFARVGLSEAEVRQAGLSYRLAHLPMRGVPRAQTLSRTEGFMKALVSATDDGILGFAMLGAQAGEVMSVVQMAMVGRLPFTALRDGIFAHPTISEGLNLLFAELRNMPADGR